MGPPGPDSGAGDGSEEAEGGGRVPTPLARPYVTVSRVFQLTIAAIVVIGVITRNLGVVVNASVALGLTALPAVLAGDRRLALSPRHSVLVTTALLLHSVGMLGLYDRVAWWDHLTHAFSAGLVAAVGYTVVRVVDEHSEAIYLPRSFLVPFLVMGTLAVGVGWELLEYGAREVADRLSVDPVLVVYGPGDTILDLVFDTVGAFLVGLFGTSRLERLVERITDRMDATRSR